MHATHGNGPPPRDGDRWETAGGRAGEARALQEPVLAGRLRTQGWRIADSVPDDYALRVYDTRIERSYLAGLAQEATSIPAEDTRFIGGDFLSEPHMEDAEALHPEIRRWGPAGPGKAHLVVQPRPHQAVWAQRCALQMRVEDPDTICTLCVIVPRDKCESAGDATAWRKLLPQLQPLFDDPALAVGVLVVGERVPLRRVPATSEDRTLPPPRWERALTPVNRVLVLVQFRRSAGGREPLRIGVVRGQLPKVASSEIELLRVEYVLPPAVRQQAAERAARKALRAVAEVMQLPEPPPQQLRQVQIVHGALVALLGVPRPQACEWLRGSGHGGLYLRPFWSEQTGRDVAREKFALLWARGQGERGPELWKAFRNKPGVYGLLASGNDVALRVTAEADVAALQAQLCVTMDNPKAAFRHRVDGQRWWRLGPLTEAEMWRRFELIQLTGLQLLPGQVRVAAAGPFRKNVYFAATGDPERTSFDDGGWAASAARLLPAGPPPRRTPAARASPAAHSGPALAQSSAWAGPRRPPADAPARAATPATLAPPASSSARRPAPAFLSASTLLPAHPPARAAPRPPADPFPPAAPSGQPPSPRRHRRGRGRAADAPGGSTAPAPDVPRGGSELAPLLAQLAIMTARLEAMHHDMQELRKENSALRAQVEAARGLQQHQPYALSRLPPLPPPPAAFTPERSSTDDRHRTAAQLSPPPDVLPLGTSGDTELSSPVAAVVPKRPRKLQMDERPPLPAPSASSTSASLAPLAAPQPHDE
jgi:hypothetical protein